MSARLAALILACACTGAAAQGLEDPTRPPAVLAPANPAGPADTSATTAEPRLQAVLIGRGPHARHVAVIDGQTVRLGEKFHGARLEHVSESEVVLVRGKQKQILKLYPASALHAEAQ